MADRLDQSSTKVIHPEQKLEEAERWNHILLIRDEKGSVRWLVNGADAAGERPQTFDREMRTTRFSSSGAYRVVPSSTSTSYVSLIAP